MTVMSVALVLFCVAVAQDEKSTKSVTNTRNYSHGVIVTPNTLLLAPGEEVYVNVVTELGYKDPFLLYNDEILITSDSLILGRNFTARILRKDSSSALIHIIADPYIDDEVPSDILYVKAMPIYESSRSMSIDHYGVPIYITIDHNKTL